MEVQGEVALRVSIFPTCTVDLFRPPITAATAALLEAAGGTVSIVGAGACCGQPAYSAGQTRDARRVARAALHELAVAEGTVVVPAGSCATFVRKVWPRLFRKSPDSEKANAVSQNVVELSEHLVSKELPFAAEPPAEKTVSYHDSCHGLREGKLGRQGRELLRRAGFQVVECENPELCCGFGGIFCQILPELATRMGADKALMLTARANIVTGGDLPCLMHLSDSIRYQPPGAAARPCATERFAFPAVREGSPDRLPRFVHLAELLAGRLEGRST